MKNQSLALFLTGGLFCALVTALVLFLYSQQSSVVIPNESVQEYRFQIALRKRLYKRAVIEYQSDQRAHPESKEDIQQLLLDHISDLYQKYRTGQVHRGEIEEFSRYFRKVVPALENQNLSFFDQLSLSRRGEARNTIVFHVKTDDPFSARAQLLLKAFSAATKARILENGLIGYVSLDEPDYYPLYLVTARISFVEPLDIAVISPDNGIESRSIPTKLLLEKNTPRNAGLLNWSAGKRHFDLLDSASKAILGKDLKAPVNPEQFRQISLAVDTKIAEAVNNFPLLRLPQSNRTMVLKDRDEAIRILRERLDTISYRPTREGDLATIISMDVHELADYAVESDYILEPDQRVHQRSEAPLQSLNFFQSVVTFPEYSDFRLFKLALSTHPDEVVAAVVKKPYLLGLQKVRELVLGKLRSIRREEQQKLILELIPRVTQQEWAILFRKIALEEEFDKPILDVALRHNATIASDLLIWAAKQDYKSDRSVTRYFGDYRNDSWMHSKFSAEVISNLLAEAVAQTDDSVCVRILELSFLLQGDVTESTESLLAKIEPRLENRRLKLKVRLQRLQAPDSPKTIKTITQSLKSLTLVESDLATVAEQGIDAFLYREKLARGAVKALFLSSLAEQERFSLLFEASRENLTVEPLFWGILEGLKESGKDLRTNIKESQAYKSWADAVSTEGDFLAKRYLTEIEELLMGDL